MKQGGKGLNSCSKCQSNDVIQTGSLLTRVLLSFYIFMCCYFFTGDVMVLSIIAILPLIVPFKHVCSNCNAVFYKGVTSNKTIVLGERSIIDRVILETFPYFMVIALLISLYPNTGLGRIIYLPMVFLINTIILIFSLALQYKVKTTLQLYIREIVIILFTIVIAVWLYPQDSGESIWKLIFKIE